jgi:hypothetical protein
MERIMLGITLLDKVRNTSIREKTKLTDVAAFCKKLKWEFAGKTVRDTEKWTADVLNWIPDGKRRRGRLRPRWEDEIIKMAMAVKIGRPSRRTKELGVILGRPSSSSGLTTLAPVQDYNN